MKHDPTIEIVRQIKDSFKLKNSLFIKKDNSSFSREISNIADKVVSINPIDLESHEVSNDLSEVFKTTGIKYDYIMCDFRYLPQKLKWQNDNIKITTKKSWIFLLEATSKLSENGYALALIESALWSKEWNKFVDILNINNIFLNAIFNLPERFMEVGTGLRPIMVLVSRRKNDELFIIDLELGFDNDFNTHEIQEIMDNLVHNKSSDRINMGIKVDEKSFKGFKQYHINDQITKLQTKYKEYESYTLQDITHEIKLGKTGVLFEEADNAIYIPKVGNSPVRYSIDSMTLKHQNYFQVLLKESIVINEYAAQFYSSDIGRLIIDSLFTEGTIPNITKEALVQSVIAIPNLKEQNLIVSASKKIDSLEVSVKSFKKELSLNPKSAEAVNDKLDDILLELEILSECDQLISLIRRGESKTLEFKETFVLNVRTKSRDEEIVKSSLKTIVAFLNTKGGILLVGVHDNGSVTGLNNEIDKFHKSSNDKFLLFFKDKMKAKIGEDFYPFVDYKLVNYEEKSVLKVIVEESVDPCYYNGEEFFVRTNPATDELKGPKLVDYISRHFKGR